MTDLIKTHGLTPKQNAAVTEFLRNGFNKKQACETVGCTMTIFSQPAVKAALSDVTSQAMERAQFSAAPIIENLTDISLANIADFLDLETGRPILKPNLTREQLASVESVKVDKDGQIELKLHNKYGAIDRLTKLLQWVDERPIVNIIDDNSDAPETDTLRLARKVAFALKKAQEQLDSKTIEHEPDEVKDDG